MKSWKLAVTAALATAALVACGDKEETTNEATNGTETDGAYPLTVTDASGMEVTIDKEPERIISMIPSNTEILFELGLNEEIIAVTDIDDYPAEAVEKEKIGSMEFDFEKIISLTPDVVFSHESAMGVSEAGIEQLRAAGIDVYVVEDAKNFEHTYETIYDIAEITNTTDKADEIVTDMKAQVTEIQEKLADVEPKRVFVENSDAPEIYTPGSNTFTDEMLNMIKAENVAATQEGWYLISSEEIITQNPDVILVSYSYVPDILTTLPLRPGFDTIAAVKNNAVIQINEDTTSRQAPRLAEGLLEMATAIHPEVFSE
ncbi:MAG: ABC transporter substrate-binding protein [Caryophanon sp.]|nr:ABC transporter substrate-binding protein [Caryophanon sp.]